MPLWFALGVCLPVYLKGWDRVLVFPSPSAMPSQTLIFWRFSEPLTVLHPHFLSALFIPCTYHRAWPWILGPHSLLLLLSPLPFTP